MTADTWISIIVFLVGAVFGLIVFMQIVYPLFSLVPKVKRILREEEREKSVLLSLLFFSPVVWTTVLLFSVLLVVVTLGMSVTIAYQVNIYMNAGELSIAKQEQTPARDVDG